MSVASVADRAVQGGAIPGNSPNTQAMCIAVDSAKAEKWDMLDAFQFFTPMNYRALLPGTPYA